MMPPGMAVQVIRKRLAWLFKSIVDCELAGRSAHLYRREYGALRCALVSLGEPMASIPAKPPHTAATGEAEPW